MGNEEGGPGSVRLASTAGRWVLAVAVLGEAMVLLEATVVNVALPAISRDLGGGVAGLQWTLNGYVLTLAALILPAGSLSDLYGRRRMFTLGVAAFVAASALCAAAPTIQLLVAARFVQGVGGALLTPGSLAIIDSVFHPDDRTRAIGAWAGLTAVAAAVGPPVGGYLTDALSWRAVFLINLPLGAFVIVAAVARVPESRDPTRAGGLDLRGAALAVFGAGLAALITPITATVLASVDARHSGIASAVNNALSRLGQMIAVAVLPLAAGLSGTDFEDPVKLAAGFPVAMTIAAGASFAAALLAWTTIRDDALRRPGADTTPVAKELPPSLQRHCAMAGTPLATSPVPRPGCRPPTDRQS